MEIENNSPLELPAYLRTQLDQFFGSFLAGPESVFISPFSEEVTLILLRHKIITVGRGDSSVTYDNFILRHRDERGIVPRVTIVTNLKWYGGIIKVTQYNLEENRQLLNFTLDLRSRWTGHNRKEDFASAQELRIQLRTFCTDTGHSVGTT